jgi:hypothetical protein
MYKKIDIEFDSCKGCPYHRLYKESANPIRCALTMHIPVNADLDSKGVSVATQDYVSGFPLWCPLEDSLDSDNNCYMCWMNHISLQSLKRYYEDKITELKNEKDVREQTKAVAYMDILLKITQER